MNYYEIAKEAYCTEGSQWDCRDSQYREITSAELIKAPPKPKKRYKKNNC